MSIFSIPEPTHDELIQKHKERIISSNSKGLQNLKNAIMTSFNYVWYSEDEFGITTQEIMDSFGNDAYKLFETHVAINTLIISIDPTYQPLVPPRPFTINQDGTVTIG